MAAKVGEDGDLGAHCDINVTPLVDVVLVLLIVFMITVPAVVGSAPIKVELPTTTMIANLMKEPEQLPVQVFVREEAGETAIYLGERKCTIDGLAAMLSTVRISKEVPVHISADKRLPYGEVTTVMDVLTSQGIRKLSLETKHAAK